MGVWGAVTGGLDTLAGQTDEAVARQFDDEEGGGIADGTADFLIGSPLPNDEEHKVDTTGGPLPVFSGAAPSGALGTTASTGFQAGSLAGKTRTTAKGAAAATGGDFILGTGGPGDTAGSSIGVESPFDASPQSEDEMGSTPASVEAFLNGNPFKALASNPLLAAVAVLVAVYILGQLFDVQVPAGGTGG